MTLLNQIVAIEKGVRQKTERAKTDAYHIIQRNTLLSGIARTYTPKDVEGDRLPSESTLVQATVEGTTQAFANALVRLFDVTFTKEVANTEANADIKIGDTVLVANAPVTYMLFLEKQLTDIRTFVATLPTLDPAEQWVLDPATNTWATPATETVRTKKVPRNWVKAEATDKHPAQVEVYHEDVIVGTWATRKFSGAIPALRKVQLLNRVDTLIDAVKMAREQANTHEITDQHAGQAVMDYIFAV